MNLKKKGTKFIFKNFSIGKYGFAASYRIEGVKENDHDEEGFFHNCGFSEESQAMLCKFKINGKKVNGVKLPEMELRKVKELKEKLKKEKNDLEEKIVEELMSGERAINWSIVGCDYPHYQPWLNDMPDFINEQDLIERAIRRLYSQSGIDIFI